MELTKQERIEVGLQFLRKGQGLTLVNRRLVADTLNYHKLFSLPGLIEIRRIVGIYLWRVEPEVKRQQVSGY